MREFVLTAMLSRDPGTEEDVQSTESGGHQECCPTAGRKRAMAPAAGSLTPMAGRSGIENAPPVTMPAP